MVFNNAWRVTGTGRLVTWVHTLKVDAGLVRWTARVFEADRERGFALVGADTERLVIRHLASFSFGTGGGGAEILANTTDAAEVRRTVIGGETAVLRGDGAWFGAHEFAQRVDDQFVFTSANRFMALNDTFVVLLADLVGTWVNASAVDAGSCGWAFAVCSATSSSLRGFDNRGRGGFAPVVWSASAVGSAGEAFGALAPGCMADNSAEGVLAASTAEAAWVDALATDTCLVQGAFLVRAAFTIFEGEEEEEG